VDFERGMQPSGNAPKRKYGARFCSGRTSLLQ
jgi:hypothetical protein